MFHPIKFRFVAAIVAALLLGRGAVATYVRAAQTPAHRNLATTAPAKQTITGVAAALPAYNPDKPDITVANATVTVSVNGTDTVYYVYGWGGVVCAKNAGKTVQVTGAVSTNAAGQLTILAASVNVKVIVVQ